MSSPNNERFSPEQVQDVANFLKELLEEGPKVAFANRKVDSLTFAFRTTAAHEAARSGNASLIDIFCNPKWWNSTPAAKGFGIYDAYRSRPLHLCSTPFLALQAGRCSPNDALKMLRHFMEMSFGTLTQRNEADPKRLRALQESIDLHDNAPTLLLLALKTGDHPELVWELVRYGSHLNRTTAWNPLPLAYAAHLGRLNSIEVLLEAGAHPNGLVQQNGKIICAPPVAQAAAAGHWQTLVRLAPLAQQSILLTHKELPLAPRIQYPQPIPAVDTSLDDARIWLHGQSWMLRDLSSEPGSDLNAQQLFDRLKSTIASQGWLSTDPVNPPHSNTIGQPIDSNTESTSSLPQSDEELASSDNLPPVVPAPSDPTDPSLSTRRSASWFSRLIGRRSDQRNPSERGAVEPTSQEPITKELIANQAFRVAACAIAATDWPLANAALTTAASLGRTTASIADGRSLAHFATAMALASLDQPFLTQDQAPLLFRDEQALSLAGKIDEGDFRRFSRPGRFECWLRLLNYPTDTPLGVSLRASFNQPLTGASGFRPAHWLALFDDAQGLAALAHAGIDLTTIDPLDSTPTPAAIAARAGHIEALRVLARLGVPFETSHSSALLAAAQNGQEDVFEAASEAFWLQPSPNLPALDRLASSVARRQDAPLWLRTRIEAMQLRASMVPTPSHSSSSAIDPDSSSGASAPTKPLARRL